ncbi:hypothetical protein DCAR_0832976 [Daucus carota subsp. sativus]|uniref:Knottin scorpion toxin-like domain-containing protein n=1 Tax=Daucus carota subsp. sativus TaxID=79200 RepID=A0AAF0XSF7_DAUCS|nr:hypothetical protein DCAR_0832976 [Daucus carota subsp. sativus]
MSFSFIAKKIVIWFSLVLLIVALEKGTIGECLGKCADLGIDCDELCRDSGFPGGGCIPILKECCCVYG